MKDFALIGAAGYIAPRHMRAIYETGNNLIAALDKSDSVGVLDKYFPETSFFTEFERFDRHLEKQRRLKQPLDYLSICSPNYLHDAHIRFGLRIGADVICEKPLVLNPWNAEALQMLQLETGRNVYNILQLRLHPDVIRLKERSAHFDSNTKADIDLTYVTPRGKWYHISWKGDQDKSGGIATNIGIHFFDILIWIFGEVQNSVVHILDREQAAGLLELERARIRWYLSIRAEDLPVPSGETSTVKSLKVGTESYEFSEGFTDLHTLSYKAILEGNGFPLREALPSINLVHKIRQQKVVGLTGDYHPMAQRTS